ncbi:MAG: hypothetical protein AAB250_05710 [Bdellovibrionota bacterium]
MKTLKLALLTASFLLSTTAVADLDPTIEGRDDLSKFTANSGVYSRSFLTDDQDGNDYLCSLNVRVDVAVRPAEKRVLLAVYTKNDRGPAVKSAFEIKVGESSRVVLSGINGINVESMNIVVGSAIQTWDRQEFLSRNSKWGPGGTEASFIGSSKIQLGNCIYRKVNF